MNAPHRNEDHDKDKDPKTVTIMINGRPKRPSAVMRFRPKPRRPGGAPDGTRVSDVYEVAGQLLKSIAYCDTTVLSGHVERRVSADRYQHPSRFVTGELESFQHMLRETPANKIHFEIYGVQPGIAQANIDEHLADLMAFGLEYVQRGGAGKAAWLISA